MSEVQLNIRPAFSSDAEGMASVSMRAWHISLKNIVPDGFLDQFEHEKQKMKYAERADDPSWQLLVAESRGKIAGMIGVRDNDSEPQAYEKQIKVMYVDPEFQRRGVGKALLAAVFAQLKEQGVRCVMAWCITANEIACAFYEKSGARRIEGIEPPEEYAAMPHVIYAWDFIK
jgi:GNAT superfamily N-acetyltransferase